MGLSNGSRRRIGLYGMPNTRRLNGMPDTRSMAGMPDTNQLNGMPNTRIMNGMPNTRKLNGGWGEDHEGRMENRRGNTFTSGQENAERTKANWKTKAERKAERGLKALLDDKKNKKLKDPHDDDDLGKVRLEEKGKLDFVKNQLQADGSLSVSTTGLCLKGEDRGTRTVISDSKKYVYSEVEDEKKWRTIEEVASDVKEEIGGGMFSWDAKNRIMGPGGIMVGRTWLDIDGLSDGDGAYWVEVTFSASSNPTAKVVKDPSITSATDTKSYIPIYTISSGKISKDLRGAFVVPCYE